MTADQHLETTFCTGWHSWRFGQRLQTAAVRPQTEKVCWYRFGWEHASPIKAKALATRSKITRHDLAQAGLWAKLSDLLILPQEKSFYLAFNGTPGRVWQKRLPPVCVAHMHPPTPCLWHCCPSFTQPLISWQKKEQKILISYWLLMSKSLFKLRWHL